MIKLFHKASWFVILFILLTLPEVHAQKTPNQLLGSVYRKMTGIRDYTVEASIRADIPLIKILPVHAVIYFKQPDKFTIKSKSIAIMPKQGFSDIARIIRDSTTYTAVLTGTEIIEKATASMISVIPAVDSGDLVLAKFWIDGSANLVLKSQLTTRSSGTILIEYFYGSEAGRGLPDKMIFTVDVKKFKIPKAIATDLNTPGNDPKTKTKSSKKGVILISLKNYKINTGLKDELFK